ncbi:hypothetical protein [Nonomuraea sp. JJY05]|uniref:hypothetical protein n=1 Tax=Nonomuraea sp. JJY05 TaxID=3350255 RepID=UPI00373E26C4
MKESFIPYGLTADGTKVATMGYEGGGVAFKVYDLASEKVLTSIPMRLHTGKWSPDAIAWTAPSKITVHLSHHDDGKPARVRILEVDTTTKKITTRDAYTVTPGAFRFVTCGA